MYQQPAQQFAPSPYMAQGPAPQAPGGMPGWQIGLIAFAVIALAAYVLKLGPFAPTAVTGPMGGVTASGTATGNAAGNTTAPTTTAPASPTGVQVATSPQVNAQQVSTLVFTRNITTAMDPSENEDWRTFQIGEVKVYDSSDRLLTASDFSSAEYNTGGHGAFPAQNAIDGDPNTFMHTMRSDSGMHQMTLQLKNPTNVKRVQVLNRADCCQTRLAGTVVELKSSAGALIKAFTLSAAQTQDLVVA